ncbi:hypothetical protein [uncultured Prevotella sp.]|uniref:hypothetical protein n=1 Tax=uncultured Prevotella sp. TaxID=159272 RepID=UPI0025D46AE7|nr:hypothetical protein [uncultured Prevotella sp.]
MKRILMMTVMAVMAMTLQAQENNYIVKTKQAKKTAKVSTPEAEAAEEQEEEPKDFLEKNFHYYSMCDWKEGMRFMVIPDKKDMVIKTFGDSITGQMVSSLKLRHKIMVYKGRDENHKGLHERINFTCEDDGKTYFFEVPTASFDDYCLGKLGVSTLAYLGDVDIARQLLKDTTLFTVAKEYYVDTELDGDGYDIITDVPEGTEVKVVAIGVGTRNFPVKIIVADKDGREFYQNVAISRTNSGLRDDEYGISNMIIHTFKGAFELPADNMAASSLYKKYVGQEVFTLYSTTMESAQGKTMSVARLSTFRIKDIRAQRGTNYVKMTLTGTGSGREYVKQVTFKSESVIGDIAGQHEDYFFNLFATGNPLKLEGVKKEHITDIQKSMVRVGYSENEVKLALGEPTGKGQEGNYYTWTYKHPGKPYACVYFDKKTKLVTSIKK